MLLDAVAAEAGSLDISFNLITQPAVHGTPLADMKLDDFMDPIVTAVSSSFLTSRAAARRMIRQGSGVILTFGGSGDPMRDYCVGGTQVRRPGAPARRPPARGRGRGGS